MFLAHAARLDVRVRQLDVISAFLQANVRSHAFIQFSAIYTKIIPEHCEYVFKNQCMG
jgi:hypothetical protein